MQYNSAHAPVAQLDRVLGYEPRGRAFESLRAHQIPVVKTKAYSLTTVGLLFIWRARCINGYTHGYTVNLLRQQVHSPHYFIRLSLSHQKVTIKKCS